MDLVTKQKQTHRHKKQTYDYQRGKTREGINQEFGINRYTLLFIKQIKKQGPTARNRELYSVTCITYNVKESEKEYIYMSD